MTPEQRAAMNAETLDRFQRLHMSKLRAGAIEDAENIAAAIEFLGGKPRRIGLDRRRGKSMASYRTS